MRIIFILGLLILTTPAHAATKVHQTAGAEIIVPKLGYTARTLKNGARLYSIRDSAASTATVATWYGVGQRDDPRGRGGFAHLFEHLMFKATRNLPDGVSAFVTGMGGQSNATTLFDHTSYYVSAPANRLESLIWLEGERLRNLVVDEAAFKSERNVVGEELRQRIFAQPYGRILYTLLRGPSLSAADRRNDRGSRSGRSRRRARLSRSLLPARQCRVRHLGEFRPGEDERMGRSLSRLRAQALARDPAG